MKIILARRRTMWAAELLESVHESPVQVRRPAPPLLPLSAARLLFLLPLATSHGACRGGSRRWQRRRCLPGGLAALTGGFLYT